MEVYPNAVLKIQLIFDVIPLWLFIPQVQVTMMKMSNLEQEKTRIAEKWSMTCLSCPGSQSKVTKICALSLSSKLLVLLLRSLPVHVLANLAGELKHGIRYKVEEIIRVTHRSPCSLGLAIIRPILGGVITSDNPHKENRKFMKQSLNFIEYHIKFGTEKAILYKLLSITRRKHYDECLAYRDIREKQRRGNFCETRLGSFLKSFEMESMRLFRKCNLPWKAFTPRLVWSYRCKILHYP